MGEIPKSMNAEAYLLFEGRQDPKNWQEDFSHENGNYISTCHKCGEKFLGHKRRITCKICYDFQKELENSNDSWDYHFSDP